MPNIDPAGKAWQLELSRRFGDAVAERRKALGLTAVQLSERTRRVGYPITRSTIARIEGNHRAGKVDLAEIVALAAALNTAPITLIYPGPYHEAIAVVPVNDPVFQLMAAQWFSAEGYWMPSPTETDEQAVDAGANWREAVWALNLHRRLADLRESRSEVLKGGFGIDNDGSFTRQQLDYYDKQIADLRRELGIENG